MEDELLSLYDYLGKPAGPELGKQVNETAKTKKIKCTIKEVSTPTYKGRIMMYPKSFLDEYFKTPQIVNLLS
jgi:hypothetical protein